LESLAASVLILSPARSWVSPHTWGFVTYKVVVLTPLLAPLLPAALAFRSLRRSGAAPPTRA
jgi:hypothetical protein